MALLRNTWYVAAWSGEVGSQCLARRILGEPLMLYRTSAGQPVALLDRCPHSLLPLSNGTLQNDTIECAINGTVVASYPKATLVTAGKLKSSDGVYGIRFAHNTDGLVTGLTVTKP